MSIKLILAKGVPDKDRRQDARWELLRNVAPNLSNVFSFMFLRGTKLPLINCFSSSKPFSRRACNSTRPSKVPSASSSVVCSGDRQVPKSNGVGEHPRRSGVTSLQAYRVVRRVGDDLGRNCISSAAVDDDTNGVIHNNIIGVVLNVREVSVDRDNITELDDES